MEIKKLETELKEKVGEDKIADNFTGKKKKFDSEKFLKLADELRDLIIEREKSSTVSSF